MTNDQELKLQALAMANGNVKHAQEIYNWLTAAPSTSNEGSLGASAQSGDADASRTDVAGRLRQAPKEADADGWIEIDNIIAGMTIKRDTEFLCSDGLIRQRRVDQEVGFLSFSFKDENLEPTHYRDWKPAIDWAPYYGLTPPRHAGYHLKTSIRAGDGQPIYLYVPTDGATPHEGDWQSVSSLSPDELAEAFEGAGLQLDTSRSAPDETHSPSEETTAIQSEQLNPPNPKGESGETERRSGNSKLVYDKERRTIINSATGEPAVSFAAQSPIPPPQQPETGADEPAWIPFTGKVDDWGWTMRPDLPWPSYDGTPRRLQLQLVDDTEVIVEDSAADGFKVKAYRYIYKPEDDETLAGTERPTGDDLTTRLGATIVADPQSLDDLGDTGPAYSTDHEEGHDLEEAAAESTDPAPVPQGEPQPDPERRSFMDLFKGRVMA